MRIDPNCATLLYCPLPPGSRALVARRSRRSPATLASCTPRCATTVAGTSAETGRTAASSNVETNYEIERRPLIEHRLVRSNDQRSHAQTETTAVAALPERVLRTQDPRRRSAPPRDGGPCRRQIRGEREAAAGLPLRRPVPRHRREPDRRRQRAAHRVQQRRGPEQPVTRRAQSLGFPPNHQVPAHRVDSGPR